MQWISATDQQMPSCKLIGINLDSEPPSHFMSAKTGTCNNGLNVGAKACILPLGYGYCDNFVDYKKPFILTIIATSSALAQTDLSFGLGSGF